MAEANAHYYATRDPLGAAGDFTPRPRSARCSASWSASGSADSGTAPAGPERRAMSSSARAAARWPPTRCGRCAPPARAGGRLVETSPVLRARPGRAPARRRWHDDLASCRRRPAARRRQRIFRRASGPPARRDRNRLARADRHVEATASFRACPVPPPPAAARRAEGTVLETSPASLAVRRLARRLRAQGGAP
jgi:NADH dehydrogenase [ubiquinone] 1 alpha subcomplex assembly factor 7